MIIHLLTPYHQNKRKRGGIPVEDVPQFIDEVKSLAKRIIYFDALIEDINDWFIKHGITS